MPDKSWCCSVSSGQAGWRLAEPSSWSAPRRAAGNGAAACGTAKASQTVCAQSSAIFPTGETAGRNTPGTPRARAAVGPAGEGDSGGDL